MCVRACVRYIIIITLYTLLRIPNIYICLEQLRCRSQVYNISFLRRLFIIAAANRELQTEHREHTHIRTQGWAYTESLKLLFGMGGPR